MILVPPAEPTANRTLPSESVNMAGLMEERGRFPGLMKLFGEGGTPKKFVMFGGEKSSISLL